jgi:mannose-1-phosphate guanylyltransferase
VWFLGSKHITSAVLLAAGFGTRLRPLTDHRAKPSLPFFDRSLIHHVIDRLTDAGIERIFINLHYMGWSIRRTLRLNCLRSVHVHFSHEPVILGTAGALMPLRNFLISEPFILINGDILTNLDLKEMIRTHRRRNDVIATIVLHPNSHHKGYPQIGASSDMQLTRFPYGPLKNGEYDWSGTFAGVHIIEPDIFKYMNTTSFQCINSDIYARVLNHGYKIGVFRHDGYWSDIGNVNSYFEAHSHVLKDIMHLSGINRMSTDFWIHDSCRLHSETAIGKNVILCPGCTTGKKTYLENVVVWPGIHVPAGSRYVNGILVEPRSLIPVPVQGGGR